MAESDFSDRRSIVADNLGRRYAAERDVLLELLAIFAHDLSNPLQSICVLCELAADEAPANSDIAVRNRQCLQAADRMRLLVHGLAAVTRAEVPMRIEVLYQRVIALLDHRFQRHGIVVDATLEPSVQVQVPGFEFAFINLCFAAIEGAKASGQSRYRLTLRTTDNPNKPELECWLSHGRSKDEGEPIEIPAQYLDRVRDALGSEAGIAVEGTHVRLGLT